MLDNIPQRDHVETLVRQLLITQKTCADIEAIQLAALLGQPAARLDADNIKSEIVRRLGKRPARATYIQNTGCSLRADVVPLSELQKAFFERRDAFVILRDECRIGRIAVRLNDQVLPDPRIQIDQRALVALDDRIK